MDTFVVVYEGSDPIEARMLTDVLIGEGIVARKIGTENAALLGAGQHIFKQTIEVRTTDAERARQIIDAVQSGSVSEQDLCAAAQAAVSDPDW